MKGKELLKGFFLQGLKAQSPEKAVHTFLSLEDSKLLIGDREFNLSERAVYILAVGKASIPMFNAVDDSLGKKIEGSLVITPEDGQWQSCAADEIISSAHPYPDESSVAAGKKAINFFKRIPENALVLTLLSGGTSSLMCKPAGEIAIMDLENTFKLLVNSGATIHEMNMVRKHCSNIKGGQLLSHLHPQAVLVDLAISDVPDNELSVIGSGPTTPDLSTFQDAYHVLLNYELWDELPESVRLHIEKGIDGEVPETIKPGSDPIEEHISRIISSPGMLAENIGDLAAEKGYDIRIAEEAFNEDVEKVARRIGNEAKQAADRIRSALNANPILMVCYGESTVRVTGDGKGGRNQELALRGALEIAGYEHISWLSAGTDGIDGPTDAAGAVVDGRTIPEARRRGLDPEAYLLSNDSYHFHKKMGSLLKTGPTGNNLMDIVLVFIG
jgi:hydroxypyruvate reductase/glycerate 2-kinase